MRAKEFILENRGLPFPGTYEEEYGMFKRKGPRRIIAMTNEEEVNEIADNPYPYRPNIKTKDKRIYRFETDDGLLYRVQVFNIHDAGNPNALEIHFDQTDKETGKQNSGITGTGDSLRVFATVADILQKEVAQQNPTGLIITSKANDTSRVKLYRTLARRATKVMPQFEITGERMVKDHEGEPYLTIILKTKDQ